MTLLHGVRVLDLTNVLAGPFASYQLAVLGADVVKVEVPGTGDLARKLGADPDLSGEGLGASFLAQNAGKRSMTVNLKHDAGREVFERLVGDADVLVENFRPGVLARFGYSWSRLSELNARLVYCAISGFGQTGPMRDRPAYDQIIQGLAGMNAVTGTRETAPVRVGFPVCDTLGGLAAAMGICAALAGRERTGKGCFLDVSMLETALTAMGWVVSDHLIADRFPEPLGNDNATAAPSGTFRTADGNLNIAANKQEQFETLCRLTDRADLITDERFAHREDRKRHRDELRAELERALTLRTAKEWEDVLNAAGVPAGRVLDVTETLDLDQIIERGLVHELPLPDGSDRSVRVLGTGLRVDEAVQGPSAAPPQLGEHTDELLAGLGYSATEIAGLRAEGAV
jgi:crotonobetainyl-CoA:carnitine CoA-transferase CaiB-like acyl-CoA transferase